MRLFRQPGCSFSKKVSLDSRSFCVSMAEGSSSAYAPLLLERKAIRIRKSMDIENSPHKQVRTVFDGKQDRS